MLYLRRQKGVISKVDLGFQNFGYDFWGFGEMFEGDSADKCGEKFPLMLIWGRANGQAWADGEQGPPSA
jgi:hypothetical protein